MVIGLNALYSIAEALCAVFVSVYFYVHSMDVSRVFLHYFALYSVTPAAFVLAGWYAKSRDRARVFRIGLALHAAYYAALLYLRESAPLHVVPLGMLLGMTWGFFWAGNNTFQFDFSTDKDKRAYFLGLISSVSGAAQLIAPLISGLIIRLAPSPHQGYHFIFAVALIVYLSAFVASLRIPKDVSLRVFRMRQALFPPKEHRDWRLIMIASATLAGSFHIFHFLLALLMFIESKNEASVGGFVALQGFTSVVAAYLVGRTATPKNRSAFLIIGTLLLLPAGLLVSWRMTALTLTVFGLLRALSTPVFGIPHTAIRFEVMQGTVADPADRIEYLCAWEVPLAIGRILMMSLILLLNALMGEAGLRFALFVLCFNRLLTLWLLRQVSFVRSPAPGSKAPLSGPGLRQTHGK